MAATEAQARAERLLGSTLADRYGLEAVLEAGKGGACYSAATKSGVRATIRVLYPELMLGEAGARYKREAPRWATLRHPHVQSVVAAGTDATTSLYFAAWPAGHGQTLDQALAAAGALAPEVAVRIALQIALGVEAAHRVGLLHRGLRPRAVLLEPNASADLVAKVGDFGTLQPRLPSGDPAESDPSDLIDAPDYTSPEQLRDSEAIDERADVFSLGAGDNPATLLRFAREAKAATAIQSPNVVRTLDAGTDADLGVPYILMELLRGTDLSRVMKKEGALPPEIAVRLVLQAARGIAAAHAQHIVHRDIKPANLFLALHAQGADEVTVKVCDFGVAKRKRAEAGGSSTHSHMNLTRTGGMLGSPMYMAPEQARNAKSVDERADVWSLSIVLWEVLSGRRLWGEKLSLGELLVSICTEPILRLEQVAPWVERGLAHVVHRGLERDMLQRTPSMDALIAALEPFAGASDRIMEGDLVGMSEQQKEQLTADLAELEPPATVKLSAGPGLPGPAAAPVVAAHGGRTSLWIGPLLILTVGAVAVALLLR